MNHLINKHLETIKVYNNKMYEGLNVLGLVADLSACGNYRMLIPFHYLNKYGANCKAVQVCSFEQMMSADIIIAQRQYDKSVAHNMLYEAQKHGKLVIYECDDNLHAVLPSSPVYGIYHQGTPQLKMVSELLYKLDGITVSTVELANDYKGYNPNIKVLPNSIDFEMRDWEYTPEDKDPNFLHLFYTGGTCFDNITEVLSENGWKLFKDLQKYERVATFNPTKKIIEYHIPTEYINKEYSGTMYCVSNEDIDYCVTPNHWMYISTDPWGIEFDFKQASEIYESEFYLKDGIGSIYKINKKDHYKKEYDKTIHCVTVKYNSIMVRRKGKAIICGNTHMEDLQIVREAVPQILKKYDFVKFCLYTSEQMAHSIISDWDLDPDKCKFIPPRSFHEYPTGLGYADISIIPVVASRFNSAKSNLKSLELGAKKVPSIASPLPPYVTTIKPEVNGLIAQNQTNDWVEKISYMIDNPAHTKQMGEKAFEVVTSDFDMDKNVHMWPEAWKSIAQNRGLNNKTFEQLPSQKYGTIGRNDPCPCGCGQKYKKCHCYGSWGH